ncbi:MAG: hypothetical protein V5A39_02845 [Haloarculaceae archaeon]
MSRYERTYGTNWETLDKDEAIERAYALGVATSLNEYHRDELEAIRAEMDTSYNKSVVDLAFDEGKNEAQEIDPTGDDGEGGVWAELVEGEAVTVAEDEDTVPTGGQTGLPEAIDKIEAIARPERDSTGAVEFPEFLERD